MSIKGRKEWKKSFFESRRITYTDVLCKKGKERENKNHYEV